MKRKRRKDLRLILSELKNELVGLFGSQLEFIYLYGSQARGDARPDSDIDVLIVLREPFDYVERIKLHRKNFAADEFFAFGPPAGQESHRAERPRSTLRIFLPCVLWIADD